MAEQTKTQTEEQKQNRVERSRLSIGHDAVSSHAPGTLGLYTDILALQGDAGNRAVSQWLQSDTGHLATDGDGNPFPVQVRGVAPQMIQAMPVAGRAEGRSEQDTDGGAERPALIVDDDAQQVQPGQMRKSDFLSQLRPAVRSAADETLSGTIWSAMGCPYIDRWFGYYNEQDSQHIERALRRYAPETSRATTAREYIPIIVEQARRGIETWRETGRVPEGMPTGMPTGGLTGIAGGLLSGIGSAVSGLVSGAGRLLSGMGGISRKGRDGTTAQAGDPQVIQAQLGGGHPLNNSVRSRMESAFGRSFSHVRMHNDPNAVQLSDRLNARAFTVGEHIAFGAGEYKPGTLVGDALIAHELAHAVQQSGASPSSGVEIKRDGQGVLEEDADMSAIGAVIGVNPPPRLRSGLRLQRCSSGPQPRDPQVVQREFNSIKQQILGNIPAGSDMRQTVQFEITFLWENYQAELQRAGTNAERQARAQQALLRQLRRMRGAIELQVQMTRDYGIQFISGFTRRGEGTTRDEYRAWSRDDLLLIRRLLRRVPRLYLENINYIQRKPGTPPPSSGEPGRRPAAFEQATGTMIIYDAFFQRPQYIGELFTDRHEERMIEYFLHEIGHSTYRSPSPQETEAGGFPHLPPNEWMEAGGWQRSTLQNLGRSLGVSHQRARQVAETLRVNKRVQNSFPLPIEVGNRMVVYDKYERDGITGATGGNATPTRCGSSRPQRTIPTPTRFFHYPRERGDDQFVSRYARTHPAEDLAESFAHYLLRRETTRRKLNRRQWNYLVENYQHRLGEQTIRERPPDQRTRRRSVQPKLKNGWSGDPYEREAELVSQQIAHNRNVEGMKLHQARPVIRRATDEAASTSPSAPVSARRISSPAASSVAAEAPTRPLIVEDTVESLEAGQMKKTEFLAQLRSAVRTTADEALSGTIWSAMGCPWIDHWFSYYENQTSQHMERAIRRYAPDAAGASTAREYIPIVTNRVRQGISEWATTGETTGIPEELRGGLSGGGIMGVLSGVVSGVGRLLSGVRSMFLKGRSGGTMKTQDPEAVRSELGSGRSLDNRVRRQMEPALGMDFSRVRIHTGAKAATLSENSNARAFTVGEHIAFGASEYQPGTVIGDALIAHELAHVVQQGNGSSSAEPIREGLEEDADMSAIGAVASLWGQASGALSEMGQHVRPRLSSGVQLQRCGGTRPQVQRRPQTLANFATMTPWQLGRISESEFNLVQSGERLANAPGPADYARASRLARAVLAFDIDAPRGQGRGPTTPELEILDRNLSQILASSDTQALVTRPGRRALPTPHSLIGRVWFASQEGFAAGRYRLEVLVTGVANETSELRGVISHLCRENGIPFGPSAQLTEQERRIAMFIAFKVAPWHGGLANGFYYPQEDTIYIPDIIDLTTARGNFLARHETVHLLGGGETTRGAFIRRFGSDWLEWWEPFEEGMAELIARESLPPGVSVPRPASVQTGPGSSMGEVRYAGYVTWMRNIVGNARDRRLFRRAYFTGEIPERVFELLARARQVPLPPQTAR